ncbi:hypothetical protein HETIRDRAFT_45808 [Heterobasidion irregulare TC 32-1]|uniref:Uncharacterized protein n=1 Tax=Heterobasidion irregulare (strain TC 32-1) TaxID=747525 RepID=W4K8G4_HETIT|nr:uncharacterized protein HETIRDRAFT_45808 [Heterobasidion irregulare TC 32-1]ETW82083.1 hypothetical protein HETIRDRAFT_45808 [Heterobasidion irregulare TC 32-1]
MLDSICNKLAIIYGLDIVLDLQLANKEINKFFSLICNVFFLISNITLYL